MNVYFKNGIWKLVEFFLGEKVLLVCWVFKEKIDYERNIKFKVRVVV